MTILFESLAVVITVLFFTVLGPLVLFAGGVEPWPFVACIAGIVAACCYVSRLTWRRWPEDEWFVLWLFLAAIIWINSGWLCMASMMA
jgi:hypothetical protein